MTQRHVLFVQGGGGGTHDEWDQRLVDSLRRELGSGWEVRYPRMPGEDDPTLASWGPAILGAMEGLDDGDVLVGHSVGATLAMAVLAERAAPVRLGAVLLLAAPFVGEGGWPGDEFTFTADLGARLPSDVPVHLFHGLDDDTAPPAHAGLYARAIPQARVHLLPRRDHQLNDDLVEVAIVLRTLGPVDR
jgi:predicted alpha/beta hydrolase family esterase